MPGEPIETTDQKIDDLRTRYSRVERAILGDPTLGHIGLVDRMRQVEADHRDVPATHQEMENRRVDGDRRAHEHIEKVQIELQDRITQVEKTTAEANARIEKKVDNLRWTVTGAAAAIVGAAAWVVYAV